MVKIKTSPENKIKVTISDLNSNIVKLTKVMQDSVALNKTYINDIQKAGATSSSDSSSSKKSDPSWYAAAGSAMWKATAPERGLLGSTIVGGLTGINPAIVQKMGIDKAIGSIFKSIKNDIKEKWAAAGLGSSNSKKVNSAIEANKVSPVTSRLDKIIKLMGLSKKTDAQQKSEEKGFLGKLFSFLGSVLEPLLKIAAGMAILHEIAKAVRWIADRMGFDPSNKDTQKTVANTLATSAAAGKAGGLAATAKRSAMIDYMNKQADRLAKWNKSTEKLSPAEKAKALSSENEARKLGKQKGLSSKELDALLKNRKNLAETNAEIRERFTPKEQARIGKVSNLHGTRPYNWIERNLIPKNKAGLPINRSPFLQQGLNTFDKGLGKVVGTIDKPLYYAAQGLNVWNTGVEFLNAQDESERAEAAVAGIVNAIRVWGLRRAGNAVGGAVGGLVGSAVPGLGTLAGGAAGATTGVLLDYLIGRPLEKTARGLTRMYYGKPFSPSKSENTSFDITAPVQQQIANNSFSLNPDTSYNGFDLTTPEKAANDFINNLKKSSINKKLESLTSLNNWADDLLFANDYSNSVKNEHNTFGLTTDFDAPIQAADIAESPVVGIEQNTNTTNEILKNILSALETGQASAQRTNFGQFLETSELRRTMSGGNSGDKFPPNVRG